MWFKRICAAGLAVFLALSLTDFVQTFALITGSDGAVYEANPIADAWLAKHGWTGLAAFKAGIVLVVVGVVAVLARRNPPAAVFVTAAACLVTGGVTVYSHGLIGRTNAEAAEVREHEAEMARPYPPYGKFTIRYGHRHLDAGSDVTAFTEGE